MNTKHILTISALLLSVQAFALTAQQTQHGCPPEVGDCTYGSTNAPGSGGGDFGASSFLGAFGTANGGMVEFYSDKGGEWWVQTNPDGTQTAGWEESESAMLVKKPKGSTVKRPNFQKSQMTPTAKKTFAMAQQQQAASNAANAAKAAAAKAAADKASAEAAQKAAAAVAAARMSNNTGGMVQVVKKP